jgi:hypothetical protein
MPNSPGKGEQPPIVTQPTMHCRWLPVCYWKQPVALCNCLMDRAAVRVKAGGTRAAAGQPGNHHAERCALECSGHPGSGERDVKYEY